MIKQKAKASKKKKEAKRERIVIGFVYIIIFFALIILFFTVKSTLFPEKPNNQAAAEATNMQVPAMSKMSLTNYDKELARKMMDKDNDGKCDSCGMDIELCIQSGQLQCNMDSISTIGILDSQHIHADWKIYIKGGVLDLSDKAHMDRMRSGSSVSSFIHVDSGSPAPEKTGEILHMHATGVPLWIFFDSIDLELPESTKVYVNGELNSDDLDYVFKDLDKILITDGKGDINQQFSTITDYAKNH